MGRLGGFSDQCGVRDAKTRPLTRHSSKRWRFKAPGQFEIKRAVLKRISLVSYCHRIVADRNKRKCVIAKAVGDRGLNLQRLKILERDPSAADPSPRVGCHHAGHGLV